MPDQNAEFYKNLPTALPYTHGRFTVAIFRWVFKAIGWRFIGEVPALNKVIAVIAPHTSNWDFFILVLAKFSLHLKASYIMKKEAFFWPFKPWLLWIGGIAIDRSQPAKIVPEVARRIQAEEKVWVIITPEGTRQKVKNYKTGFLRIAYAAKIPVLIVGLDYKLKAVVFSRVIEAQKDYDAQALEIQEFCRSTFVGRIPENQ